MSGGSSHRRSEADADSHRLLNTNDLWNNHWPHISSIYIFSICVMQAIKRTYDSYSIVLVVWNEFACYYFSSALHFKWQPKKARLFRSGRRPRQRAALPSNHLQAARGKKGARSKHAILHIPCPEKRTFLVLFMVRSTKLYCDTFLFIYFADKKHCLALGLLTWRR